MRGRITVENLAKLRGPSEGGRSRLSDDRMTGFIAMKHPGGRITFHVEYGPRGKQRRYRIAELARVEVLLDVSRGDALAEIREAARLKLAEVAMGSDPVEENRARKAALTWRAWVEEYLKGVVARKKRPEEDVRYLQGTKGGRSRGGEPVESEATKRWGDRPLASINAREVEALLHWYREKHGKTTANRWHAALAACLSAAMRAGVLEANPAALVRRFPENPPRDRVLSDTELAALRKAVSALEDPEERALWTVLLETGCRRSEALRMRWEHLDLERLVWVIPSPKAGRPQAVPLALSTVATLRDLTPCSEWVFPGRNAARHRVDVRDQWTDLRSAVKAEGIDLKGVNVHDLRRTYGLRVARHAGILAAQKLLRHSTAAITSRVYTPLGVEDLRDITEAVNKAAPATVAEFQPRKDAGLGGRK